MTERIGVDRLRGAIRAVLAALLIASFELARASVGLDVIPASGNFGPITLFYPSAAPPAEVKRGPFTLDVAFKGAPIAGNRRLIVMSHGSGGSPSTQADLARVLVDAGFVVAMPEHVGDNFRDMSLVGPKSWKRRPVELSHAIDAVAADPRFAPLLDFKRVGVYGMSAGGLTALAMAGGRWSPALFVRHCDAHIAEDFPACVGLFTRLKGNWADGLKIAVAKQFLHWRLDDATWVSHNDPRIGAVVAAVPMAAPFDPESLAHLRVPVGLVRSGKDAWLAPRFHIDAVRKACNSCSLVADLPRAGHGAMLSPFPPDLPEAASRLLADPPGFDRTALPAVFRSISNFFTENLKP